METPFFVWMRAILVKRDSQSIEARSLNAHNCACGHSVLDAFSRDYLNTFYAGCVEFSRKDHFVATLERDIDLADERVIRAISK